MDETLRRTIDELVARYMLEPQLRDLYVEGSTDKRLFEWFLKQFGCESVAIFEISFVDIPDALTNRLDLQSRNRDRVVALAVELERALPREVPCLLCIADSDFDFLLGGRRSSQYLRYTDYTSVDLYFCFEYVLEKCFMVGIGRLPCDASALLTNLAHVLQEVFCIRAANEKLGWGLRWIDFTPCCRIENVQVMFDRTRFITRYLSANSRLRDSGEFNVVCEQLRNVEVEDFRHRIHGHDYLQLVGWYISRLIRRGGHKYGDPMIVRAMIFSAIDVNLLAKEELFKELLKTYKS